MRPKCRLILELLRTWVVIYQFSLKRIVTTLHISRQTCLSEPPPDSVFSIFSVRIAEIWQTIWVIWGNGPSWSYTSIFELLNLNNHTIHMGPDCRILHYDSKNVILKIENKAKQRLGPFFSLFLMRKPLWSKVVSEAIYPTNGGHVRIKKWS